MRKATQKDKEQILQYLHTKMEDCIYLYIDVMNYGVESAQMKVWVEKEKNELVLVVMKYYDSFQIYTHRSFCDISTVLELLKKYPVSMISAKKVIIEQLERYIRDYRVTYGTVFLLNQYRKIPWTEKVLLANERDAWEIARLICSDDEIGGHYTIDNLAEQLAERIRTGTGRSYVIRENGSIIAHSATYAEAKGVAVVGGTIIKPEYRNNNYYMILSNYMLQKLESEKKVAYTFSISDKMIRYHTALHTKCGEYGKLIKIAKDM